MAKSNSKIYEIKNICCIGAGYVGGPTMAVLADKCPELKVNIVDINCERINLWNGNDLDSLPIFEPGLKEVIARTRGKNLFFSTDIDKHIKQADMIFISVNTPIKTFGIGAGQASDLRYVEATARRIGEISEGHTIVVEKSTLPVRTAQVIKDILASSNKRSNKSFSVLSNPEFLAEGTAINDLINPDRVLIGGEDERAVLTLEKIYLSWVNRIKIYKTNLWSSELSKLTANAFLAQRISSINSISAICESTGADIREVSSAIGSDTRIGNKFLSPGPGYGGSCFKKDILNLVYLCRHFNLFEVADFWEGVLKINDWQKKRIYENIVNKLYGNLSGKKLAILGFSFKANTNDTRDSPAIEICRNLLEENAFLGIYDPKVSKDKIISDLEGFKYKNNSCNIQNDGGTFSVFSNIEEAIQDSNAVIILTEWKEFNTLDWEKISQKMQNPAWVFDTRGISKNLDIKKAGLKLWYLGVGGD